MAKRNLRDLLIMVLTKRMGCRPPIKPHATKKYIVLEIGKNEGNFFFVGKHGALRYGKNVSSSVSVLEQTKQKIIHVGRKMEEKEERLANCAKNMTINYGDSHTS